MLSTGVCYNYLERELEPLIKARDVLTVSRQKAGVNSKGRRRAVLLRSRAKQTKPISAQLPCADSHQHEGVAAMQFVPLDYSSFAQQGSQIQCS